MLQALKRTSLEHLIPGAKVTGSENFKDKEQKFQGPTGTFAPGNELAREQKSCDSPYSSIFWPPVKCRCGCKMVYHRHGTDDIPVLTQMSVQPALIFEIICGYHQCRTDNSHE